MKKQLLNLSTAILLFFSATITNAQSWNYVVSSGTGVNTGGGNGVSGRDLCVVSDQEIYTAMHASSSDQIEIYKYNGTSWTMLPSPNASGQVIGNIISLKKSSSTNDLYLAYSFFSSSSYSVSVKKFNGSAWSSLGTNLPLASGSSVFGFQLDNNDAPIVLGSKTSSISDNRVSRLESGVWAHYTIPSSAGSIFNDNTSYIDNNNNLIFAWFKTVSVNSTPASIDTLAGNTMKATPENINMMFSSEMRLGNSGNGQILYNYKTPSAGKIALKTFKNVSNAWINTTTDTLNWNNIICIETLSNGVGLVGVNGAPRIFNSNDYLTPIFQSTTAATIHKIRSSSNYVYALLNNGVVKQDIALTTAINSQPDIKYNFSLYPNPANQSISIQGVNFNEGLRIKIISIEGKIMKDEMATQSTTNVSDLNPGMYFIELTDSNGKTGIMKFIKE